MTGNQAKHSLVLALPQRLGARECSKQSGQRTRLAICSLVPLPGVINLSGVNSQHWGAFICQVSVAALSAHQW